MVAIPGYQQAGVPKAMLWGAVGMLGGTLLLTSGGARPEAESSRNVFPIMTGLRDAPRALQTPAASAAGPARIEDHLPMPRRSSFLAEAPDAPPSRADHADSAPTRVSEADELAAADLSDSDPLRRVFDGASPSPGAWARLGNSRPHGESTTPAGGAGSSGPVLAAAFGTTPLRAAPSAFPLRSPVRGARRASQQLAPLAPEPNSAAPQDASGPDGFAAQLQAATQAADAAAVSIGGVTALPISGMSPPAIARPVAAGTAAPLRGPAAFSGISGLTEEAIADDSEEAPSDPPSPPRTGSLLDNTIDWTRAQAQPIPGWSSTDRLSACGHIAAEALERVLKGDPDLDRIDEIKSVAVSRRLWNADVGMYGIDAERTLIAELGIETVKVAFGLGPRSDMSELRESLIAALTAGKPAILSTTRHYFFVQGYSDGKFFVGHTGEIMSGFGGKSWMTLEAIANAGAEIHGLLLPQGSAR